MTAEAIDLGELDDVTVARVFDKPQTVRLKLQKGESRPKHQHPGNRIVLFVHEGHLELSLDEDTYQVAQGQVICFSGDHDISPTAVEDSQALLVFTENN